MITAQIWIPIHYMLVENCNIVSTGTSWYTEHTQQHISPLQLRCQIPWVYIDQALQWGDPTELIYNFPIKNDNIYFYIT